MGKEILEALMLVGPFLKDIMQIDMTVAICDKTKFIAYYPGHNIDVKVQQGKLVEKEEPMYITLNEGKTVNLVVPKEFYGFAFRGIGYPIKEKNGEVIGGIALGVSLESNFKIQELTKYIFDSLKETNASTHAVAEGAESLSKMVTDIIYKTKDTEEKINKSNESIKSIKKVSSQSNLLGLNASIEAARAGEAGRGFSVVASEIKKLTQLSGESSEDISKNLSAMTESIEQILKAVHDLENIAHKQVNNSVQIKEIINDVMKSVETLVEISSVKS